MAGGEQGGRELQGRGVAGAEGIAQAMQASGIGHAAGASRDACSLCGTRCEDPLHPSQSPTPRAPPQFGQIFVSKPLMTEADGETAALFPREARLRNLT